MGYVLSYRDEGFCLSEINLFVFQRKNFRNWRGNDRFRRAQLATGRSWFCVTSKSETKIVNFDQMLHASNFVPFSALWWKVISEIYSEFDQMEETTISLTLRRISYETLTLKIVTHASWIMSHTLRFIPYDVLFLLFRHVHLFWTMLSVYYSPGAVNQGAKTLARIVWIS